MRKTEEALRRKARKAFRKSVVSPTCVIEDRVKVCDSVRSATRKFISVQTGA